MRASSAPSGSQYPDGAGRFFPATTDRIHMSARSSVGSYYAAIDEDRYDDLHDLLAPGFAHERPDRTFDGRETFVKFMRDDRPRTETTHEIDAVYADETQSEFAVRGRLLDSDSERLFGFVDVHTVENGSVARIRTYTD
jgi:ketosteroid isomerase-like protein